MKSAVQKIPSALQRVILIRLGLALLMLILAIVLIFRLHSPAGAASFLLATPLLIGHAAYIGWLSAAGRCLKLKGTVLGVEWSFLGDKPKALLLEAQGVALRIILHGRMKAPTVGSDIVFYIPDTAMLYEWRGMHQINSYLAMDILSQKLSTQREKV